MISFHLEKYNLHLFSIFECLDRGYKSNGWFMNFPYSLIINFPITCSDLGAIIFSNESHSTTNKKPYQFGDWCLSIKAVWDLVQQIWNGLVIAIQVSS